MTNPWLWSILIGMRHLRRKCPKCGHEQLVPKEKQAETVRCKHCGADVPPKPPRDP
ncbi:MAG: hypothetical protein HY907_04340 [Deltaproteobacteria bacterium]|nr:hypothetical protein [Deltaproteobacteria bacterium]